jgi:hypothetical protein
MLGLSMSHCHASLVLHPLQCNPGNIIQAAAQLTTQSLNLLK